MYIYDALINALSAHMIHINLNMIFYTHVEHSPTKTIYIKYYKKKKKFKEKKKALQTHTVSVFFFALACERIFFEAHNIESRCYTTGKYTVCRRVHASFSPEILQAGAVKGLMVSSSCERSYSTIVMFSFLRAERFLRNLS